MKKTCDDCRALDDRGGFSGYICSLGLEIKTERKVIKGLGAIYTPRPTTECPKPKTYAAYFKELSE